jgi:acetyl-CoA carboxylase biotin carboxyl carrier protein
MAKSTQGGVSGGKHDAGQPGRASRPRAEKAIDTKLVRELAEMVGETGVAEIEVKRGDLRIRVSRYAAQASAPVQAYAPPALAAVAPVVASPAAPEGKAAMAAVEPAGDPAGLLRSPMVGTAYLKPSPEAKVFIEVGSEVKAGDKVLLIEAMKTFNDIVAHRSGRVGAILVENAQPVEFGQPLLVIE